MEYAPGLHFYQKDIDEFIRTKSAAHTMVEIMLRESGLELDQAERFYVAGAFGKHVSKESAITIGMYPDMLQPHYKCRKLFPGRSGKAAFEPGTS